MERCPGRHCSVHFEFDFNFDFEPMGVAMAQFDPAKMAMYRLARQHDRAVHALLETANTRGFADLVGQLRGPISIPANLLEAASESFEVEIENRN